MTSLDEAMCELASKQHGLVSRAQARALGATASALRHRLAGPLWDLITPRVLRLVGVPCSYRQRLMAAVLDTGPGAAASHAAAAALWSIRGFQEGPLDVSLRRARSRPRRRPFATLHEPAWLPPHHVTSLFGIPVTTPARTLFGLAAVLHPVRAELAVDAALGRNGGLLPVLWAMLSEMAEHGRNGIVVMRTILEQRPIGYIAPASGLEARAVQILDEAGIKTRRQVNLGGDDWIGRVDLLVEGVPLILEIDSVLHHTTKTDRERDSLRDAQFAAIGLTVERITEEMVWGKPAEVAQAVRAAIRRLSTPGPRRPDAVPTPIPPFPDRANDRPPAFSQ